MKNRPNLYNEDRITEILASTGFIFPRNITDLRNFEILFENDNFGLTGLEIDPDIILDKNSRKSRIIKLSEAKDYLANDLKLVAKTDEDNFNLEIKKLFKKTNKKKISDEE
jgi:hypothetical protein